MAPVSAATTWTIYPGTGVINATINNGNVHSGDTILLTPGTYFENNINVSTNINIVSSGSQANTFIDGDRSIAHIFDVTGPYALTITGVTMRNGGGATSVSGGAIYSLSGGTVTVVSSTISNCSGLVGGGIISDGNVAIVSSTISNCSAAAGGGVASIGNVAITSSTISNCSAEMGGADYSIGDSESVTITSSTISNCSGIVGGAIFSYGGDATITSSTITGCTATEFGGAIAFIGADQTEMASSMIATNLSHAASVVSAVGPKGTGFFSMTPPGVSPSIDAVSDPTTFSMTGTTISGCSAEIGGAIRTEGGNVIISSSKITGCTVSTTNGGGAIDTTGLESGTIQFSQIFNNTVPEVTNNLGISDSPTIPSVIPLNATENFWGTNSPPPVYINGSVMYAPWLMFRISAEPASIIAGGSSAIQASLIYDSGGNNTYSPGNAVADGTPVSFAVISGAGGVNPSQGVTAAGVSTTAYSSFASGTAVVNATVDGYPVSVPITVTGKGRSVGTCYWCSGSGSSGTVSGYTGPSTTQVAGSPTQIPTAAHPTAMPTQQVTVNQPVTASSTVPPLPTNTPKSGIDAVPVIGALSLCGVIVLFRKDED